MKHKTVFDKDFKIDLKDTAYKYQKDLTDKLDLLNKPFNQNIINEIVLWKVNRYASINNDILKLLNKIDGDSKKLNLQITRQVLQELLKTKGIQLPMASTILRFKNKNIYQIIDQRVYRIIYKEEKLKGKLKHYQSEKNINEQIDLYIKYLYDLKRVCVKLEISFENSDRILYESDKRINPSIPLDNY